jgi:hypothetical protein
MQIHNNILQACMILREHFEQQKTVDEARERLRSELGPHILTKELAEKLYEHFKSDKGSIHPSPPNNWFSIIGGSKWLAMKRAIFYETACFNPHTSGHSMNGRFQFYKVMRNYIVVDTFHDRKQYVSYCYLPIRLLRTISET